MLSFILDHKLKHYIVNLCHLCHSCHTIQNTRKYLKFGIVYKELSTLSCRVSYVPRLAEVVNVLAIRQVKQGTETTRFRIVCTRVNMLALDLIICISHISTHKVLLVKST